MTPADYLFDRSMLKWLLALAVFAAAAPAQAGPSGIAANYQTATLSAAALPSLKFVNGVVLKAKYTNTGVIFVGPCESLTTANGYPLQAGEPISYAVPDLSAICMIGQNTSDVLNWTGN